MSVGILVFTQEDVLQHKLKDGKAKDYAYCYWEISRFPKRFDEEINSVRISKSQRVGYSSEKILGCASYAILDSAKESGDEVRDVRQFDLRLYLAIKGKVRGYFHITALDKDTSDNPEYHHLRFHSEDWIEVRDGEQLKPSQGWRYYLHEGNKPDSPQT